MIPKSKKTSERRFSGVFSNCTNMAVPTGNLDGANTQNIINILCGIAHEKGYCVIIVTHDAEVAEQADVELRMRDGELHEKII